MTLDATTLAERLDELLEVEFSFRNTAGAALALAQLPGAEQAFVLDWVDRVAGTNIEVAFQFALLAPRALATMEMRLVEAWARQAMDAYDRAGLHPALEVIKAVDDFVRLNRERTVGALLEEGLGVLLHFLHGLSGRALRIAPGEAAWTDSETVFLPQMLARLPSAEDNFRLYKASAAMLWAQTRFGTFRAGLADRPEPLLALFHTLETRRLEACIARELPGLGREMARLRSLCGVEPLPELEQQLADPSLDAAGVMALAEVQLGSLEVPPPLPYQGELRPEAVAARMAVRIEREKLLLRVVLRQLLEEEQRRARTPQAEEPAFSARRVPDPRDPAQERTELVLEDRPVEPPEGVRNLLSSIELDLGGIPPEYLVPAGPGEYDPKQLGALSAERAEAPAEGDYLYDEWDYRRQHYRKGWCVVHESGVAEVHDGFVERTFGRYRGLIGHLRKTFEAMRDENRLLKRQTRGDDVDIDALVEAIADSRDGSEMTDRLFTKFHRAERNIAVAFMVDMSGSTRGWINEAERESLLLLCEALEAIGDRFAIYGFSGMTRKRCFLYRIKRFDEPYGRTVQGRIAGIEPKDYTRMGFAIRHLNRLLLEQEARTRVLITLSDGKPDDYTDYRGEQGIEDTRRALIEARRDGIHPYCITLDREGGDYLPHMYGPAAYTVVDEVRRLPYKVADIYRRLTT